MRNRITNILFFAIAVAAASCAHDGVIVQTDPGTPEVIRASDQSILGDAIDAAFAKLDTKALAAHVAKVQADVSGAEDKSGTEDLAAKFSETLQARLETHLGPVGKSIGVEAAEALTSAIRKYRKEDAAELEGALLEEMDRKLTPLFERFGQQISDALKDELAGVFKELELAMMPSSGQKAALDPAEMTAYIEVVSSVALPAPTLEYIRQKAAVAAGTVGIQVLEVRQKLVNPFPDANADPAAEEIYPDTHARLVMLVSCAGVDEDLTKLRQRSHASAEPDLVFQGKFKGTFSLVPRMMRFAGFAQELEGTSAYPVTRGKYVVMEE